VERRTTAIIMAVRILVTGGRGFIGSYVVAAAMEAGHEVSVVDRSDEIRSSLPSAVRDAVAQARFIHIDVCDESALLRSMAGIDVVVHQAAKVGLGEGVLDAPDYVRDNDLGTAAVVSCLQRASVPSLVLASSMVVYGAGTGLCVVHGVVPVGARHPEALEQGDFEAHCECGENLLPALVDEECVLRPSNIYAATKVAQEHLAASWARHTGGTATALRYHNVYGAGLPRDTPYAGVAALFVSSLLGGAAPRVYEDGGQLRDFVNVRDIARANLAALDRGEGGSLRAYNVGSGQPRTIHDVAIALSAALDGPDPVVTGQFRLGDVRHITASSQRIAAELNWSATEEFSDGMAELATATTP
jgi:dTDP-L-rhamnose 4-epimerase